MMDDVSFYLSASPHVGMDVAADSPEASAATTTAPTILRPFPGVVAERNSSSQPISNDKKYSGFQQRQRDSLTPAPNKLTKDYIWLW